ncbi:hypothetical protein [Accumulibacter sp.]|nr:hypothetical protein [Accumulibacter sp.]MCM8641540.1 hypothetical protein [Accumulibacter sp.]
MVTVMIMSKQLLGGRETMGPGAVAKAIRIALAAIVNPDVPNWRVIADEN